MEKQENEKRGNLSSRLSNGAKRFGNSTKDGAKRFGKYALIGGGVSGLVAAGVVTTLAVTGYWATPEDLDQLPIGNGSQLAEQIEVSKERNSEYQLNTYKSLIDEQTLRYLSGGFSEDVKTNKDLYESTIQGIYNQFRFENGENGKLNEEFAGWDHTETFEGIQIFYKRNDGEVQIVYSGEDDGIEVIPGHVCKALGDIYEGRSPDEPPLTDSEISLYNSTECNNWRAEQGN